MRLYELVVVLKTSLSDVERKKVVSKIKDLIKDVKIVKEEEMGQKPLAYKIKKELAGFYHLLHFELEKGIPADFETRLINNESVLRHLLVRRK